MRRRNRVQGIDTDGCLQGVRALPDNAEIDSLLGELESLKAMLDPEPPRPVRDPGGRSQGKSDTSP